MLPPFKTVDCPLLFKLAIVPGPGLSDIKWNELYHKWGKFIPEEKKIGFAYYEKEPPVSVKKIAAQRVAAKKFKKEAVKRWRLVLQNRPLERFVGIVAHDQYE